jgi:hypothetical protein
MKAQIHMAHVYGSQHPACHIDHIHKDHESPVVVLSCIATKVCYEGLCGVVGYMHVPEELLSGKSMWIP